MKTFKVICDVENAEKGKHEHQLFVKNCNSQEDAETKAKLYFMINRTDYEYYGVKSATELKS